MEAVAYEAGHEPAWEALCAKAINATFLHTRRFLSYHGERFKDRSALLMHEGKAVGLLPAAELPGEPSTVMSHPGATYGGLLHDGWLGGSRMIEAFALLKAHYAGLGYSRLRYKALPYFYALAPAQDDLYALARHGGRRYRCDLSSTIDLASRKGPDKRGRYELRQAAAAAQISREQALLSEFMPVLAENLSSRHKLAPVHSFEELELLRSRFPDRIFLRSALIDGKLEAGTVVFASPRAWHLQYMGSTPKGREHFALDLAVESVIEEATAAGLRYLDFGNSNEEQGSVLNDGLFRYKAKFGASGTAYEFYELECQA
jgi:hypothetical protein